MRQVIIWEQPDARANGILQSLIQQAKYPWVYRKLNSARFHLIETHTTVVREEAVPCDS